jgi:hypothetical protein
MRTLFTDRHRDLFVVLFWIFEALFVASSATLICKDWRFQHQAFWFVVANIALMFSFVGLLVASFVLRRSAQYLANIGWLTLTGAILIMMVFPEL